MKKPENLTLEHYWEANSSEERIQIIEDAFAWIQHLEENNAWNEDIESVPKGTDILFVVGDAVKFGQFAYYSDNDFECLSEMITADGEYERYSKNEVSKWKLAKI